MHGCQRGLDGAPRSMKDPARLAVCLARPEMSQSASMSRSALDLVTRSQHADLALLRLGRDVPGEIADA